MRFVCGPIPPSRVLNPQDQGWTPLREFSPGRFSTLAMLIALPFALATAFLVTDQPGGLRGLFRDDPLLAATFLLAVVLMTPVHELIHAMAYGHGIRSPHLILGFWPSRFLPYAIFDSPLPRRQVLVMVIAPFLTLSLVPLLCLPWLEGAARSLVVAFCSLHTALCGGDVIVFWLLFSQVPRKALVHNNGWQTYWSAQLGSPAESTAAADGGRNAGS
jgi:hypothetical protein